MKIGFAGLGKMGLGMAWNLLRASHEISVYNRSRERAEPLERVKRPDLRFARRPRTPCRC